MNEHESTASARPVDPVVSAAQYVPGAGAIGGMVGGLLGAVGLVSPRARRVAAYTGARKPAAKHRTAAAASTRRKAA